MGSLEGLGRGPHVLACRSYIVDDRVDAIFSQSKTHRDPGATVRLDAHDIGVECVALPALGLLDSDAHSGTPFDDNRPGRGSFADQIGAPHRNVSNGAGDVDPSFEAQLRVPLRTKTNVAAKFTNTHEAIHRQVASKLEGSSNNIYRGGSAPSGYRGGWTGDTPGSAVIYLGPMKGPRVLVTGATGFIGRPLCDRLADSRTWTAVGRTNPAKFALPIGYRQADLSREADARAAIPEGTDILVHLASYRGAANDVTGHFRTTSAATLYLCDAARRAGVKRIVLMSTTSVYEPSLPADSLLPEDARRARKRPLAYGFSKKWAEDAAHLQALLSDHDMRLWVLRPGVVVGPGLRTSSWLRSTVRRLRSGHAYPLTGERGHRLGLVAVEDVIDTLAVAIGGNEPEGTEAPGPVWNIVSEPWWERDVVETLAAKLGVTPKFQVPSSRDRGGWNDEPLSVAGDGSLWIREMGAIRTRPVTAAIEAIAASEA